MSNVIGGHPGLRVERKDGVIVKTAHKGDGDAYYQAAVRGIKREAAALKTMLGSGFAPALFKATATSITEEDLGDTENVVQEQRFRRACVRMLWEIRQRNIRHGDLTDRNIIVHGDRPQAIDWQEAHAIGQKPPQKRPQSDSALLFRCLNDWKDAEGIPDPSRVTRRWRAILKATGADLDLTLSLKGKTLLDLGTFQGDHVAMAAAEGMIGEGVDHGGFRGGEDSIEIARELWAGMGCTFTRMNLYDLPEGYCRRDYVLLFSTWAWMVQTGGREAARAFLRRVIAEAGTLFFETQLKGDGPGPDFLPDDNYTAGMLRDLGAGKVASIGSFPVPGRVATRTVWMVRK